MQTMNTSAPWFDGFEARDFDLAGTRIHARIGGRAGAPPLLLVHGFPQSHVMWHRVAQALAPHFQIVLPDLRGYGDSAKPVGDGDHANYSKRTMALDLARLMQDWATTASASPATTAARGFRTGWRWTTRRR